MLFSNRYTTKDFQTCGLIKPICLPGPEQMALDVLFLEKSLKETLPFPKLRFYSWSDSWLSIGRNQKQFPRNWANLVREGKLKIVRRPSGGGAVLHSGGLTYSLIWPGAPKKRKLAYKIACQWLIEGFSKLGMSLKLGEEIAVPENTNCFSRSTIADLIDEKGYKRVGSAQLWKFGNLLQHGEIIIDPPSQLWWDVFGEPPPEKAPKTIPRNGLGGVLEKVWISGWPNVKTEKIMISQSERNEALKKSNDYVIEIS
ncbi:lipoate--protein ligase family protein [Prochlorococcus sp. MIT 1341]|uniref:lipoate--protein ligase family protein n=1 Tax=Prochlorococcus sp. MIT 1341 TaxID=3096221 RepID=UPI002A76056D|nr:lipoate--protein ligase family protein [Prochlorococcus sp. MIT 1341]